MWGLRLLPNFQKGEAWLLGKVYSFNLSMLSTSVHKLQYYFHTVIIGWGGRGGLENFANWRGAWQRRGEWCIWGGGGWYPQCTIWVLPLSSSPVTESRKNFWVERKFLLHVLIWPNDFKKIFGANHKMIN